MAEVRGAVAVARAEWALDRHAARPFLVLAVTSFLVLLFLGRHGSFYADEWIFIGAKGLGTIDDLMRPWNSHWSLVPFVIYRAVFLIVGLHSYIPYLALLLALHLTASAALFVLVRRSSGAIPALASSALFLVLGSGFQNLFWAFQIGFVASTAAGLWALVLFEYQSRRARLGGAVLCLIALASSAMGVAFAAASGVRLLADPRRRRAVLWLLPVALVFASWYVTFGHAGSESSSSAAGHAGIEMIPAFVAVGPLAAIHGLWGFGPAGEWGLYLLTIVVFIYRAAIRGVPAVALGGVTGLLVMFTLIAIARGIYGPGTTNQPRYVYEAVVFALLIWTSLLGRAATGLVRHTDSGPRVVTSRGLVVVAIVTLTYIGIARDIQILPGGAAFFADAAGELRATIALMDRYDSGLPIKPPSSLSRFYLPTPEQLSRAMTAAGRLDRDVIRGTLVLPPTPEESDRALWRVMGGFIEPTTTSPPGDVRRGPRVVAAEGIVLDPTGGCLLVQDDGAMPKQSVTVVVPDGGTITMLAGGTGRWTLALGRLAPPQAEDAISMTLDDVTWQRIQAPQLGDGSTFQIAITMPGPTSKPTVICESR